MYSKTIASRNNLPRELFVAEEKLKEIWEKRIPVERGGNPIYPKIDKHFTDIVKPSAMHIKEGHVFEAKAVVWNNPLKPTEISEWGELNNIGGGGYGIFTKNKRAAIADRYAKFKAALNVETKRCLDKISLAKGNPPPEKPVTKYKEYWGGVTRWEEAHPEFARPDGEPPKRNSPGPSTTGQSYMPLLFKNEAAYFVAPKFSTVELRSHPAIFVKGKGQAYVELDGLMHFALPNGGHRFLIIELKKEKGASGYSDAEQMRKAATLLRKWGFELTGKVPVVELYFAAGAADSFRTEGKDGYEYNSEKEGSIQDYTLSRINEIVSSRSDHIAYIRTPVMLLTGVGLADLLRMNSHRFDELKEMLTDTQDIKRAARYFRRKDYKVFKNFLEVEVPVKGGGRKLYPSGYRPANDIDLEPGGPQLYLNLHKLVTEDQEFRKLIPEEWRPNPLKVNPPTGLARVAEGLVYINALKRKMAKPGINANKMAELKKAYINHHKYLLSNRLRVFLNPNQIKILENNLGTQQGGAAVSPKRNVKFYSRVLKHMGRQNITYFKRNKTQAFPEKGTGTLVSKPLSKVRFGISKIRQIPTKPENSPKRPIGVLPEYLLREKVVANINFGNQTNLTPNKLKEVDNDTLARWAYYILKKLEKNKGVPPSQLNVFNKIANGIRITRNRKVPGVSEKENKRREDLVSLAGVVKQALTNYRSNVKKIAEAEASRRPSRVSAGRSAVRQSNTSPSQSSNNNRPRARSTGPRSGRT